MTADARSSQRRPSLQRRLLLGLAALAMALLGALLLLQGYFMTRVAEAYVQTRLEHDSETLLSALEPLPPTSTTEQPRYQLDPARVHPVYQRPFSGHYYQISVNQQSFRSRSLWDEVLPNTWQPSRYPALIKTSGPQQQPLLVLVSVYYDGQTRIEMAVAESLADLRPHIVTAQLWSMSAAGLLVVILLLLQVRWLTLSLRPLKQLQAQLRAVQQGDRDHLHLTRTFVELEPLVNQLNQLMQALEARTRRSREAIGNLAHALKTPLAVLQQLQQQPHSTERDDKMGQQLEAINTRVNHELKRARIAGASVQRTHRINVRDGLDDLLALLHQVHRDKTVQVTLDVAPDIEVRMDQQDFTELCGNLLDNAFKWCAHHISVQATANPRLWLRIEDDGPGCAPAQLEQLKQRGTRLDEQVYGHGLGLSIVAAIAAEYDGSLEFASSANGFVVTVALGAAAS